MRMFAVPGGISLRGPGQEPARRRILWGNMAMSRQHKFFVRPFQ
jgi:hypothetical protein